ncbi:MAG: TonB-dependent receptor [Bacteroidales bacterium]|nr:TonB-dependent receptor [Bacteroidales bacterium]
MKKIYQLFFLAIFLFAATVSAQTVKGHIYDAENNEPLVGVNITYKIKGVMKGATSDIDGAYEIVLPEGGVDLLFSYIGYDNESVPLVIEKRGAVKDIYMKRSVNLLEDVVVSAGRFEQKISDITVSMDLLKASDIKRQAPTDLSATLNTLPGVDVNDKQPSIRGGSGWTYGVGSRSQILVDGISVLNPGTEEINWNTIPLENVEQVEVLKGASSVLYGSSALNGLINVRTARPGLSPKTGVNVYMGIYGDPANPGYQWSDKTFWKSGKYPVEPFLRKSILTGVRNPIYEGVDVSHSRRIGDFDVSGGLNFFTDEGYREQGYNKRFRVGGNLTYHQPGTNVVNYGFNVNFLSNQYGDFFIWRSPKEAYRPSPFTNMGREGNTFYIDPFFNFTNPVKQTSHKIKGRFYYRGDNIVKPGQGTPLTEILGNMGTDVGAIQGIVNDVSNGDYSDFLPLLPPLLEGDLNGIVNGTKNILDKIFPTATTSDYCDLIGWVMNNGLPQGTSDLIPWLSGVLNPQALQSGIDKNYSYYLDYQFSKKWNTAQITTGATYEHMQSNSLTTGLHNSDNAAFFFQYDQRFFDRLSISLGLRTEYYRVDDFYREAETKILGTKIPVKPIFRGGINYQLADYSFIRASFGQGYRYPSLTEKYARKDIGGVGVYPNHDLKAEKGFNAELGFKQGYKLGNLQGSLDIAGFYTQYTDMIEFRFGIFNNKTFEYINSLSQAADMLLSGAIPGIGAQFYNVSKARIYGVELTTSGEYVFNRDMKLFYTLGYVFIEPEDADYKKTNEREAAYTDPLQMKEKSNTSKYLKYRQKHTAKATLDFQWKRISLGANLSWKSKTLAVDYLMVDERPKYQEEVMDYVRNILFGNIEGETLATYWQDHNKGCFLMDLRAGVKVTKEIRFQFMINNLLNKEYSIRPMAVSAPRTYVMQLNMNF